MRAADIMTPNVLAIQAGETIEKAIRLMLQHRISGLPVVDADSNLVGIVTEGDFLRRTEIGTELRRPRWIQLLLGPGRLADDYVHSHAHKIEQVMTRDPATVTEDAPLDEIVRLMEKRRVKRLPVVRGGKLVGIVSRANLLHALAGVVAEVKPTSEGDADIRARIMAEIDKQPWAPKATINVIVRDRVVQLWGAVFDERERQALRVAIENIPGVKSVEDHLAWIEPVSGWVIEPDEQANAQAGAAKR